MRLEPALYSAYCENFALGYEYDNPWDAVIIYHLVFCVAVFMGYKLVGVFA